MVKKLFLFTLLVSSFLLISCNNKDKTGSTTTTSISSTWYGTYFVSKVMQNKKIDSTVIVSADGIQLQFLVDGVNNPMPPIGNDNLIKVSDDFYKTKDIETSSLGFEFAFSGTTLTMTIYTDGTPNDPFVHNRQ